MKFSPQKGKDDWDTRYNLGIYNHTLEQYPEEIEFIKNAVDTNMPLQEFIEKYPDKVILVLGDNPSGVNVANLTDEIFDEWTW